MSEIFKSDFESDANKSIGFLFIRAYNIWHYSIQSCLKEFNINHTQFVVMTSLAYLLQTNDSITQVALAKHVNIDVMTLSKLLKKLVTDGYIEKREHESDTRAKVLLLTEKGREIVNQAVAEVEKIDQSFFGKLSDEKRVELFKILTVLGNNDEF